MYVRLTIPERLKDLRVEHGLTLEQLSEATGISRAALGKYEADDFKDISPFSIAALAKFYGVSTDYLMGLTETKNHPDTDLAGLHLSDGMLMVLKSGKINNRLLCEMATHEGFRRFMADAEIYVDRIADMRIADLNALLGTVRQQVMEQYAAGEDELYVRTLELAQVEEDEYFSHVLQTDLKEILRDIRAVHKKDATTADTVSPAADTRRKLQEVMEYEGSDQEKQVRVLCDTLSIPYDRLKPNEFAGLIAALEKSELLKTAKNLRGRQGHSPAHGKGKRKKR